MSFITERYMIVKRNSGKYGLLGKHGWYEVPRPDGNGWGVKVFAEYRKAVEFRAAKHNEELEQRKAKKAAKEETEKIVEEFKKREEIKALLDEFCHNNGDGTCTIRRDFHMASGKKACIEWNNGYTMRSWNCVSLYVEGEGCLFTSGTIETVMRYIATH